MKDPRSLREKNKYWCTLDEKHSATAMIQLSTFRNSLVLLLPLVLVGTWISHSMLTDGKSPAFLEFAYHWTINRSGTLRIDTDTGNFTGDLLVDIVSIQSREPRNNTRDTVGQRDNLKEPTVECSEKGDKLVGPLYVDRSIVPSMADVDKLFSLFYGGWVGKGGVWRPRHCQATRKVAIILPYRNRYEQLKIFLRHIHPVLKRQLLDYRIFTIEQEGDTVFNRAILLNIGFKESVKFDNYQCFIFHDVDLLPEDDRNLYSCPSSPRHMCPAVDKFFYRLPYKQLFGGVEAFWKKDFEKVNGFSNKYWGWGGEDDDLFHRAKTKGLHLTRPSMNLGRYKMVKLHHNIDDRRNQNRTYKLLREALIRMDRDGLNSLKYKLLNITSHLLYTNILVQVNPETV